MRERHVRTLQVSGERAKWVAVKAITFLSMRNWRAEPHSFRPHHAVNWIELKWIEADLLKPAKRTGSLQRDLSLPTMVDDLAWSWVSWVLSFLQVFPAALADSCRVLVKFLNYLNSSPGSVHRTTRRAWPETRPLCRFNFSLQNYQSNLWNYAPRSEPYTHVLGVAIFLISPILRSCSTCCFICLRLQSKSSNDSR